MSASNLMESPEALWDKTGSPNIWIFIRLPCCEWHVKGVSLALELADWSGLILQRSSTLLSPRGSAPKHRFPRDRVLISLPIVELNSARFLPDPARARPPICPPSSVIPQENAYR
jgi:hypothetical protein